MRADTDRAFRSLHRRHRHRQPVERSEMGGRLSTLQLAGIGMMVIAGIIFHYWPPDEVTSEIGAAVASIGIAAFIAEHFGVETA